MDIEVSKKWEPEFMPRARMKDHPIFGWQKEVRNRHVFALHFNSGVSVFFRSYAQAEEVLQSGSPHAIFCDEELPFDLYPELSKRLLATDGYFHMVFTATLGQEEWRQTIEERGVKERFKDAAKWQVSLRKDCTVYEDGTPSPWTPDRIQRAVDTCQSEAEVLQRIDGKFVVAKGLKYESFQESRNVIPSHFLPKDWKVYVGIDIGTGGENNHPAAITFVGVNSEFTKVRVFKGWRGDGIETESRDILEKFREMKGEMNPEMVCYDHQARDFYIVASRSGQSLSMADKARDSGEGMLNTLFKTGALCIYDSPDLAPLVQELKTLKKDTPKTKAKDDAIDSLRYAITQIPFNWEVIMAMLPSKEAQPPAEKKEALDRWGEPLHRDSGLEVMFEGVEEEMEAANALYEI